MPQTPSSDHPSFSPSYCNSHNWFLLLTLLILDLEQCPGTRYKKSIACPSMCMHLTGTSRVILRGLHVRGSVFEPTRKYQTSQPTRTLLNAGSGSRLLLSPVPLSTASAAPKARRSANTHLASPTNARTMATAQATKVHLTTSDTGAFSAGVREDTARTASEVLQDDLEKHHVFFNNMGFHSTPSHLRYQDDLVLSEQITSRITS